MSAAVSNQPDRKMESRFFSLGLIPVVLFIALVVIFRVWQPSAAVFEPPHLLAVLNAVFLALMPFIVAYLAGRSYLATGSLNLLLIGCAVLVFGAGNLVAGWAIEHPGPNSTVTIHNIASLVASIFYVMAAFVTAEGTTESVAGRRAPKLFLAYLSILLFAALLSVATIVGMMPPFFVVGRGPTPLREIVLTVAVIFQVLSAIFALRLYWKRRISFLYWYCLALLLIGVGLAAVLMQPAVGSPIGWVGRISQYVGCIYFLAAVIVTVREARSSGASVVKTLASYFRESEIHYRRLVETAQDPIILTDSRGQVLLWNPAAERLFGFARREAAGSLLTDLVGLDRSLVGHETAPAEGDANAIETTLKKKDGSILFSEVSAWATEATDGRTTTFVIRDITERKRAEEERSLLLAEVENRAAELDATISSMATGLIVYDPAGKAVRMNDTAKGLLPSEVFLNTAIEERGRVIPWETEDGQPCPPERIPVARAVRGETVHNVVLSTSFPNGKLWISASAAPIRTSDGRMLGVVASFVDITDRKKAEEEIRKSFDAVRQNEEQLRVLIQNVGSGVALIDEAGRFSVVNRVFLRMFGLDGESDILNVNNQDWGRWEVCGEDGKLLHVDDHPVRKAALTGKPVINQLVAVRNPGANEPTWMLVNAEPLLREDGTVYTVISTYHDITERKHMEEELHKSRDELELRVQERTESLRRQAEALSASEKEFRSLAEAMPQIVWITRADGWNIYFNQQWVDYTGLTLEESYGNGWNKPFHPDDQQRAWDAWQNAVTNNGAYSLECRLRKADGTYRWWLVRGVPVVNEKGETTKWFGTCTDIEEFKRVEDQLRQAQKMEALGTLTGGVAHDFNNILAAIIGFTELVVDHVPKESREAHHLKRVMESSLRGRDLVRQMLTFSRKAEQDKKPLSLRTIVEATVKLIRATTPTTISIKVDTLKDSGLILADPTQMQQVVMNLCTNAAHAMREKGGTLDIQVSNHRVSLSNGNPDGIKPGLYTRLTVRDTGTGISPDIMDKIFDPFFTTKKLGEGTGLGLSVIHGIVKQSNGHITVESKPDRGSTFTVYFPQITGELEADAISDDEIPTGSERILFIDDEEALVEMGEDILAELGYEVTSRMNGKEALTLFRQDPSRFDLVITDQTMPEMTGVELTKEILALQGDMPIIMCTGFNYVVDADKAKAAGIRAFAMKPLTKREIARTIRKVLDK